MRCRTWPSATSRRNEYRLNASSIRDRLPKVKKAYLPQAITYSPCIRLYKKHAQDASFLMFLLHWVTGLQWTLYGALEVTQTMLQHLINCCFIIIIITILPGKTPGGSKITKVDKDLFGSAPYSSRSSSIKPSCSKTELNCCTTTEVRRNKKNDDAQTSLLLL